MQLVANCSSPPSYVLLSDKMTDRLNLRCATPVRRAPSPAPYKTPSAQNRPSGSDGSVKTNVQGTNIVVVPLVMSLDSFRILCDLNPLVHVVVLEIGRNLLKFEKGLVRSFNCRRYPLINPLCLTCIGIESTEGASSIIA